MMSGMNKWDFCRYVSGLLTYKSLHVVMTANIGEEINAAVGPLSGASGTLDKPFRTKLFNHKVEGFIERIRNGSF